MTNSIRTEIAAMSRSLGTPAQSYYDSDDRCSWREILGRFDFKDKTILEIGAFAGWLSYKIQLLDGICYLSDIYTGAFHDSIPGICADKGCLPFRSMLFDFVVCRDTLHHGDLDGGVYEAWRVLKPGGAFICLREPCISSLEDEQEVLMRDCAKEIASGIMEHRPNLPRYLSAFSVFDTVEAFDAITLLHRGDINYGGNGLCIIGKKGV